MDDITGLIMGIGLAVVISIIIMRWQKRKRSQAWQGTVTDIRHIQEPYEDGKGGYVKLRYRVFFIRRKKYWILRQTAPASGTDSSGCRGDHEYCADRRPAR